MKNHEFLLEKDNFAAYVFGFYNEILVKANKEIKVNDVIVLIESDDADSLLEGRRLYYKVRFVDRKYKIEAGHKIYRYGLKRIRRGLEHRQRLIDKLASQSN
jgi:pyruvate/2-oxoglutarate dehydrogenase complex dihydrolipoamide acyltransferase (E2) component